MSGLKGGDGVEWGDPPETISLLRVAPLRLQLTLRLQPEKTGRKQQLALPENTGRKQQLALHLTGHN